MHNFDSADAPPREDFSEAVCYIDCETGGERDGEHQLIEIAALRVDRGSYRSYNSLVKPKWPITPESSAVHQLRDEDIYDDAPSPSDAIQRVLELSEGATWIMYNSPFDLGVIRSNMTPKQLESAEPVVVIDAFRIAARAMPDADSHKLHALYHAFKIEKEPMIHRAANDVRITRAVTEIIAQRAGIKTAEEMLNFSLDPIPVTKMKFGKHAGQQISEIPDDYIEWWLFRRGFTEDENFDLNYSMAQEWSKRGGDVALDGYRASVISNNYLWAIPFAQQK